MRKIWHSLQYRSRGAWTQVEPLSTRLRTAWTWGRHVWGRLPLNQQVIVVAGIALTGGALAFAGGLGAGAVTGLAMLAVLTTAIGRGGEEASANRRHVAGDREPKRAGLPKQNAGPSCQIDESHRRWVELNDMVLRRVGVELHDGPAQLISLALLRLDSLLPQGTSSNRDASLDDYERIRGALQEALAEIRCMSAGLTLPELSCVSPSDVLRLAVRNHERRTATSVTCELEGLPHHVPAPTKSCLYRFAQEALNNAYRHAGGRGQTVRARLRENMIEVEVADSGPGFEPDVEVVGNHLGLLGMRERVASLGGTLEINSRPGAGTRLTTRLKMAQCDGNPR